MVKKFLKIAGVKSEAEFYKKYPSEAAFFKAHPDAKDLKKMKQGGQQKKLNQLTNFTNDVDGLIPIAQNGLTECGPGQVWDESMQMCVQDTGYREQQKFNVNQILSTGTPKTGPGTGVNPVSSAGGKGIIGKLGGAQGIGGLVQQGINIVNKFKEEKKQLQEAKQEAALSGLVKKAGSTRPEPVKRKYVRPEDMAFQPEQLYPTYGVGTNYLQAQDGRIVAPQIGGNLGEVQNTYAPNNLYMDLGYEPLGESDVVKQYAYGGGIPRAQIGGSWGQLGGQLGSMIGGNQFGQTNAGADLGSAIGSFLGPVGGFVGGAIGGALDQKAKKTAKLRKQSMRDLQTTGLMQAGENLQTQYSGFMEEGGWVSHDWQPQVITTFGEHKLSDLLRPDPMMDTLRTGGRITQNNMYPTDRFAMGGDLKTHWGGKAETMSYNPYLPDGGETVMFRGQSHAESDGKGNTGIGVTYGDSPVEVERGEPAVKLKDGSSGDSNLVVYGDLMINKQSADEIGDPKAKGRKFKHYVADLSKQEAKQNKIVDKTLKQIEDLNDDNTPFGRLKASSAIANMMGANMTLKDIASKKMDAAAVQNAINDTAKEHGLVASDLANGKIKFDKNAGQEAKYGTSMRKAQTGDNIDPAINGLLDLLKSKGYDLRMSSGYRPGAKTSKGTPSQHGKGGAMDVVFSELGEKAYDTILQDRDVVSYMMQNGITAINEYDPDIKKKTKATGNHIHFGFDKGTPTADKFRRDAASMMTAQNKPGSGPVVQAPAQITPDYMYGITTGPRAQSWANVFPRYQGDLSEKWDPDGKANRQAYEEAFKVFRKQMEEGREPGVPYRLNSNVASVYEKALKDFNEQVASPNSVERPAPSGKSSYKFPMPYPVDQTTESQATTPVVKQEPTVTDQPVEQEDRVLPPRAEGRQRFEPIRGTTQREPELKPIQPTTSRPQFNRDVIPTPEKQKFPWEMVAASILPYLRPSDAESLDPNQLAGEMAALATNQLEPVQAQQFMPQLKSIYDISLQDQLNEITAQQRAAERMTGSNPAAQAFIAAQSDQARQKVLADQFRANQAIKAQIIGENIDTLNKAQMTNLGILDTQYQRQSEAKSKTKATAIEALKSISDKISRNKLENRTLQTYENLYNYRFDPKFRAVNYNAPATFNVPQVASTVPVYDNNGNVVAFKQAETTTPTTTGTTTTAKYGTYLKKKIGVNSNVVKAMKSL